MRWLLPFFRPRRARLLAAQGLALAATGLSLVNSQLLARAVDVDVAARDRSDLALTAALYALTVLGTGGLTWLSRVWMEAVSRDAIRSLKEAIFAHLVGHDIALHDELPPGRLISRISGDTEALQTLVTEVVLQVPADLALFVGLVGVVATRSPQMGWVIGATAPAYAVLILWFRRFSPPRFVAAREVAARMTGFVSEHLRALPVLRAYDRVDWLLQRADALGQDKCEADIRSGLAGVWFFNGVFAVRSASYAVILWVGALGVQRGAVTVGVLLMTLDYARKMFEPFTRLQFHMVTLERARVGAGRIRELLDREPTVRAPPGPAAWRPGEIRFEGVSFAYRADEPILRGIDLAFAPGTRVALVGPTGSGKSTLTSLLFRFRDPDAGRVTVGGVDVRDLDPAVLRREIGLVSQAVQLLPGTVAENLGVDEARATALLREVGLADRLAATDRVGEGGRGLSRGEAQLLCFARAIATEPGILVLDEATASMDPETEARISALLASRPDRTVVTVAHRLRTIEDADCIHVLVDGRVVESGSHGALLARGGAYAALWRAQVAAEGRAA
jgi:ABC-type multidrug transport system fused ATPase/permease subunit